MDETDKRRVAVFSGGVVIGTLISMVLFHFWQNTDEPRVQDTADIVVSDCELKAGEPLLAECARVRTDVASRFVPPQALEAKDLDWHIGKRLKVDVAEGNALRTVDFQVD